MRGVAAGANPMDLKRGIDLATAAVIQELAKKSKKITSNEEIAQVGTISSNGDSEVGDMIAQAMKMVGDDGVITVEEAKSLEMELDVVEGMQFDRGYISPYFMTNAETLEAVLEDTYVLLHEKKISNIRELIPLLEKIAQVGKPLLIIAEDMEEEALAALVINRLQGVLRACAVKAPGFGDRRKAMLADISVPLNAGSVYPMLRSLMLRPNCHWNWARFPRPNRFGSSRPMKPPTPTPCPTVAPKLTLPV